MAIRDQKYELKNKIPVNTALISVFDKSGLDLLVAGLVEANPNILILSTGGTFKAIKGLPGNPPVTEVAEYTKFPEMEGGLVKTLHPKLYAGMLGERNNPSHIESLKEMQGRFIDLVAVNLYPFNSVVSDPNTPFEKARGNIDIGGPTMIRASAKNFMGCAVITNPSDYASFLQALKANGGCTTFEQRFELMQKAFETTADYEVAIEQHFANEFAPQVKEEYNFEAD